MGTTMQLFCLYDHSRFYTALDDSILDYILVLKWMTEIYKRFNTEKAENTCVC